MNWAQECVAVVPCLNEARAIGPLLYGIKRFLPNVIVIDDGSTDDTSDQARAAGAEVLRHETPRGKGNSLRAGWDWARQHGFKWAMALDGDGQHSPDDIPAFLARAERGDAPLIIGDRMRHAQSMPTVRRLVNRWMSKKLSQVARRTFPDSQCGFRLVKLEVQARIPLHTAHFEIESEQLLAFAAAGERIGFVPVRAIYRTERSKINPWRDTVRWFRWLRSWQPASSRPE